MTTPDPSQFFEKGFPLEKPSILLPWGKPLSEIAEMSGGVWHNDRYLWNGVKYLNGLDYTLASDNGVDAKTPFTKISAYIGLTPQGWLEAAVLSEYKKVAQHLVKLFGEPQKQQETLTWQLGNTEVYLDIIDQSTYKCYLTIGLKN